MPERAAHEIEILHRDDHRQAVERAARGDQRILLAGLGAGLLQPVGVALVVAERSGSAGTSGAGSASMDAVIEQRGETLLGADAHMMAALRADVLRRDQIAVEDHLAAAGAFAPEIVRRVAGCAPDQALDPRADEIGDPVHGV